MVDCIITGRVVITLNNVIIVSAIMVFSVITDIRLIAKCHLSQFIEGVLQGLYPPIQCFPPKL